MRRGAPPAQTTSGRQRRPPSHASCTASPIIKTLTYALTSPARRAVRSWRTSQCGRGCAPSTRPLTCTIAAVRVLWMSCGASDASGCTPSVSASLHSELVLENRVSFDSIEEVQANTAVQEC